jgi:hypothetical protein
MAQFQHFLAEGHLASWRSRAARQYCFGLERICGNPNWTEPYHTMYRVCNGFFSWTVGKVSEPIIAYNL